MIRPNVAVIAMLAGALAVGAFGGAAYAQTKLEGARVLSPTPRPSIPTRGTASVDIGGFARGLTAGLPTGGGFTVQGNKIDIGHYNVMDRNGAVLVAVSSVPAGTYSVKFTFVNVGKPVTMNLAEGINKKSCSLVGQGGYQNEQSCFITVQTNGGGFNVKASFTAADEYAQVTWKLVEVAKDG